MQRSFSPDHSFEQSNNDDTLLKIDYKRVLFQIYQYWYIVLFFVLSCFLVALLVNRYSTKIYPINASILIKETDDSPEGKLFASNPLLNLKKNYLNELYIVKSFPLIQQNVRSLNLHATFFSEGNVLTTESYGFLPIKVSVIDEKADASGFSLNFQQVDHSQFSLSSSDGQTFLPNGTFRLGDTLKTAKVSFVFYKVGVIDSTTLNKPFIFAYTPSMELTRAYVDRLNAEWAEEGAGVINLSIKGATPRKEIDFLNGLIRQFENYNLVKKNLSASKTIEFISEQLKGITDSLKIAERKLELFKDKNVVTDLNSEALRLYKKVEELEIQRTELTLRSHYYKYLSEYLQEGKNLDQVILPSSVGIGDDILNDLISKMVNFQLEMKMMISRDKLENPLVVERRNRIREIKEDIIESIQNQKSVDKIRIDFLNKGIAEVEKQLGFLPAVERQLVSIKRNYSLLENLYVFLLQKKAEAGISKASNTSDVAVVNPPLAGAFISPKPQLNYILALLFGLAMPILFFVLLEILNTKVQSKEDIEKYTSIPFIGGIGHKNSDINLEVLNYPKSSISESFRALRSSLSYFTGNSEKAVFLITSSISGEGKTFTTINLASILSLSGKRTLIVGADLRRPKLFQDFSAKNNVGLSSFLAGFNQFSEIVQPTEFLNLDLISGGPTPPNPAELLLTKRMEEFIQLAKASYDYIIIDTPPLAIVTDAFALAGYADHIIFLVRQNYTPKELLKAAQDYFVSGKLKNISIVFNDVFKSGAGYGYGSGYSYGYGYGYGYGKNGDGYYS